MHLSESFRDSLLQCIEKAQQSLASINDAFSTRCQKLADVVKKPWEDPVLYNLIQERDAEIGSKGNGFSINYILCSIDKFDCF